MDSRGQAAMVGVAVTLIISLVIGIIVIHNLFVSGAGPTKYPYQDENGELSLTYDNVENKYDNPNYDKTALDAFDNVKSLSWAGIGLMALAIIVLAAVTILGIVRGGLATGRGV